MWNQSPVYLPHVIEIVDIYPACELLWELRRHLAAHDCKQRRRWVRWRRKRLDERPIKHLVRSQRGIRAEMPELSERVRIEAAYPRNHAHRMRYAEFDLQDLFVGSGVVEAGCRSMTGGRR